MSQFHQNYYHSSQRRIMDHYERIFQQKLAPGKLDPKLPVSCSLFDIYQTQKELLQSSKSRKETIQEKNRRIAQENLKYREQLQQRLTLLQHNHDKNRRDSLTKVIKSEQRKRDYRKEILSKHKEAQKDALKQRLAIFRQHAQHMHQFWNENKVQTERSFRSQSAVRPLYWETVDRKKGLERQESQKGLMVKSGLLKKHQGREKLVHEIHEKKKQEVHEAHKEKIQKTLSKNLQLFDSRIKSVINSIGDDFRRSEQVLQSKQKNLQKKLKDKLIDQEDHRLTVRSNFQERVKQRSSSLSQCGCRRINNVEQSHLNSNLVKEELRHSYFGDSLKKIERQPSEKVKRVNQFLTRSQSFRSSVSYNKNLLTQTKLNNDAQRLKREKEIAQAIALKKQLQIQGNCYIRKTLVK